MSGVRPAFAITLVSVVAGAIAIGNVAAAGCLLSGRALAGALSALALMLAHTFWKYSGMTESYAIVAALQSGKWLALAWAGRTGRVSGLWLAALLNGLGVSNHMLAGLATPILAGLAIWLWRFGRLRTRDLAIGGLLWLIGTLPYSALVLGELLGSHDLVATLRSATVGTFGEAVLNTTLGVRLLIMSLGCMVFNYPGLTLPLALLARPQMALAPRAWVTALWLESGMYFLFAVRYPIVDQYTFFVPVYVASALLASIGLGGILRSAPPTRARRVVALCCVTALWTPAVYALTTQALKQTGWLKSLVRNKPYRDGYGWFLLPWGRFDTHADQLNDAVGGAVGENGLVLIEDHMQGFGVRYALAAGELPAAVEIVDVLPNATPELDRHARERFEAAAAAGRPIVLVPTNRDEPRWLPPRGAWARVGDIYRWHP